MVDSTTLGPIGIERTEERVYRALVSSPRGTVLEVSSLSGVSTNAVRRALASLEQKGLVSRVDRGRQYVAARPDVALEALVLRRQEELRRTRRAIGDLVDDFRKAAQSAATPIDLIELVAGPEAVARQFDQIQRAASKEVAVLDKPPYASTPPQQEPVELEGRARGVRYRVVYDRTALAIPGRLRWLEAAARAGEEQRVLSGVPLKLAIGDRLVALVPLSSERPTDAAVIVRSSALLDALTLLFDSLWDRAIPMPLFGSGSVPDNIVSSEHDRWILALLASGLQDSAIARHLGLGMRTVGRRVRRLMDVLDASTRFQAGVQATRRGLLTDDPEPDSEGSS